MPFTVDYSGGADFAGQNAGAFAKEFTGQLNKQALVDAEVAKADAYTSRLKLADAQSRARDASAKQLASFSVEWQGPDKGYVKSDGQDFAGVDQAGNLSPLDHIRRRKLRGLQEIARQLPADMLQPFMAVRALEMEEEIVQAQRESIQDQLGDLAGRLAQTPYGLDKVYGPEIENALKALDDPNSDPNKAEAVFNKIQGVVQQSVIEQQQFQNAQATLDGIISEVAAQGGDVTEYASIYGNLLSGAMTPEEARSEALKRKFNLGPETWTVPGTNHKMEIHSQILRGRGRNVDELDDASAADAWMMGVAMAREDPSLGDLGLGGGDSSERVFALAERYAMMVIKQGGWRIPPGYAGKPWESSHKPGTLGAWESVAGRVQAGELKGDAAIRKALTESGFDPDGPNPFAPQTELPPAADTSGPAPKAEPSALGKEVGQFAGEVGQVAGVAGRKIRKELWGEGNSKKLAAEVFAAWKAGEAVPEKLQSRIDKMPEDLREAFQAELKRLLEENQGASPGGGPEE